MASLNPLTRELVFKLVFYGPGLGGKTSTLQFIFDATKPEHRGKMVSLATPTDRTLYFDFLPLRMPRIRGMSVRLQLFTVPGQMYFAATRKLVLAGADGIVFVADSQSARLDANRESMEDLKQNLLEHGRELEMVPHTLQFNKRDLDDTTPIDELDRALNVHGAPSRGTVALNGAGVFAGLEDIARRVIRNYESEQPRSDSSSSLIASAPGSSEVGLEEAIRGLTERITHETPPQGMAAVRPPVDTLPGTGPDAEVETPASDGGDGREGDHGLDGPSADGASGTASGEAEGASAVTAPPLAQAHPAEHGRVERPTAEEDSRRVEADAQEPKDLSGAGATSPPPPLAVEAQAASAREDGVLPDPGKMHASDAAQPATASGAEEAGAAPPRPADDENGDESANAERDHDDAALQASTGNAARAVDAVDVDDSRDQVAPAPPASLVRVHEDDSDQDVTQVFDSAATAHRAESEPPADAADAAEGAEMAPSGPLDASADPLATTERAGRTPPMPEPVTPPEGGAFSLAPLWPEAERPLVREAEALLGSGDGAAAMRVCEPLVFRALAAAAVLVGGAEAPREPSTTALLLGIEGVRYLAFRIAARRARAFERVSPDAAYDALLLALEARRIRHRLERV